MANLTFGFLGSLRFLVRFGGLGFLVRLTRRARKLPTSGNHREQEESEFFSHRNIHMPYLQSHFILLPGASLSAALTMDVARRVRATRRREIFMMSEILTF